MANAFDMACPNCGDTTNLDIQALIWVRVTADGTDPDEARLHDHDWEDKSECYCDACDWAGKVRDTKKKPAEAGNS